MGPGSVSTRPSARTTAGTVADAAAAVAGGLVAANPWAGVVFFAACWRDRARLARRAGPDIALVTQRLAIGVVALGVAGVPLGWALRGAAVVAIATTLLRVVEESLRARRAVRGGTGESAILVGEDDDVARLAQLLVRHPEHGLRPVATATRSGRTSTVLPGAALGDLGDLIAAHDGSHVVLASPSIGPELEYVLGRHRPDGVRVSVMPPLAELLTPGVSVTDLRGLPLVSLAPRRAPSGPAWLAKRAVDYVLACIGLIVAAPFVALIAVAIRLDSAGPVFFRQTRIGRDGRPFRMWKFRSMVIEEDAPSSDLRGQYDAATAYVTTAQPRITRVGKLLRRYCLDELPELFNVVTGDMSLVGPRPCLAPELAERPDLFEWRLGFLPGVTGPWQVAGRSWLPVDEGLRMDLLYIEHWSVRFDLQLIVRTVLVALKGARKSTPLDPDDRLSLDRNRYLPLVVDDDLLPGEHPVEVSIIVVTHESAEEVGACLDALPHVATSHEVIVVDNASGDGTADLVAERAPGARLIRKRRRDGFATNSNIGSMAANGRYLLFLNPDARVQPGAVENLVAYLDANRDVGVAGPRLVYPDGSPQASARRFPSLRATIVRRTPLRWIVRTSAAERRHLMLDESRTGDGAVAVDWLLGAALTMTRELFFEMGGFDDGYRLYCEDIDLCWRLHGSGRRVVLLPSATVVHDLGELTRRRFATRATLWHVRSMVRFVRKNGLMAPTATAARPEPVSPILDLRPRERLVLDVAPESA